MASCSQPPPPSIPAILSQPSDIELAKMLRARVVDPSATPAGNNSLIIHDADVYAQDPADLTQHLAATVAEDGQQAWYFSTKLEPKSQRRGNRKKRCMDSGGVWRGEGKSKPVVGSQARRYLFSFLNKDGTRTGWIMHEFRLPGNEESPVVLCKVFRSSRWCAPNPAISATAEAQAQAEVEVKEALLKAVERREVAVEAREAAVKVREEASAAREAAVEAREALARRDAAVWEGNLQERQRNLAAREAAWQERLPAREVEGEALTRRDAGYIPSEFEATFGLAAEEYTQLAAWQSIFSPMAAAEGPLEGDSQWEQPRFGEATLWSY